jgi:hypothetical protein
VNEITDPVMTPVWLNVGFWFQQSEIISGAKNVRPLPEIDMVHVAATVALTIIVSVRLFGSLTFHLNRQVVSPDGVMAIFPKPV